MSPSRSALLEQAQEESNEKMIYPLHLDERSMKVQPGAYRVNCSSSSCVHQRAAYATSTRTIALCLVCSVIALMHGCCDAMVASPSSPLSSTSTSNARALVDTALLLRQKKNDASASPSWKDNDNIEGETSASSQRGLFGKRPAKASSKSRRTKDSRNSWTAALFDEEDRKALEDLSMMSRVRETVDSVTDLQTATGTEIPDMELHLQLEAARNRADAAKEGSKDAASASAFIESHLKDASDFEKLAMTSIPMQLPQPAQSVLNAQPISPKAVKPKAPSNTGKKLQSIKLKPDRLPVEDYVEVSRKVAKTTKDATSLLSTTATPSKSTSSTTPSKSKSSRVTHEQELQLARIIQRGAELHHIKTTFESEHGRDITRQEWTELAKLKSPSQLRKLVSDYRRAKTKLVTANMGLVHAVVKNNYKTLCAKRGISQEELVQEGSLGLIRAAELFDPSRGLRFSTYATIWIKGVLSNSNIHETITLPAREKSKFNKIQKATEDLIKLHESAETDGTDAKKSDKKKDGNAYTPTIEEIASVTGLKISEVMSVQRRMTHTRNVLSLDYQYESQSRSGAELSKTSTNDASTGLQKDSAFMADVHLFERLQLRADIIAALARNLDPREARLMRLRYGLKDGQSRTINECAEAMGISRSKAQQLAAGCLKKLREADDAESLQEYLLTVA